MRKTILAALAAMLAATPAFADWGPTKWGADRNATIAALGSPAAAAQGDKDDQVWKLDLGAQSSGIFEGITVTQLFYFNQQGGLAVIRLQPDKADCPAFIAAVRTSLGKPADEFKRSAPMASGHTMTGVRLRWRDEPANLEKMLSVITFDQDSAPRVCQMLYAPFGTNPPS